MATGGDRNEVWMLSAIMMPKNSGSMPKSSSSGRKIGTKMTMISVHSSGQPSTKMMVWARIMKVKALSGRALKKSSTSSGRRDSRTPTRR